MKVAKLQAENFNFGSKVTNEVDADYGGFYQRFEHATVYWHPVMVNEAHEVHGGILAKYESTGGFGASPSAGKRLLGFPLSDETTTKDKRYAVSYFEWGAIFWKNGGVAIYGKIYEHWKNMRNGGESSWLGFPLADPVRLAGGEAVFFEFGCLWYGAKSNGDVVEIEWLFPLLGNPWMIKPAEVGSRPLLRFQFNASVIDKQEAGKLLQELFDGRTFLKETAKETYLPIAVNVESLDKKDKPNNVSRYAAPFSLAVTNRTLKNRRLYDLCVKLPNNQMYPLSPHCVYARDSWTDFGFIHATDVHASRRLDGWRDVLKAKGFDKGARVFNNCNDNFREFIRYANKLHDRGELDFVLLTGDLVDYIFEDGGNTYSNNNFVFFRNLVLGTAPAPDREKAEELTVPVFTTLGNHDYRTNAYYLRARINVADAIEDWIPTPVDDAIIELISGPIRLLSTIFGGPSNSNYDLPPRNDALNLTKEEAVALTGNRVVSSKRGAIMVHPDANNEHGYLDHYFKYINKEPSYVVNLDDHRIVMIDGKWDKDPIDTFVDGIRKFAGSLNENERYFADGSPNSVGFFETEIEQLKNCLNKKEGLLIVGVHNPVMNPEDGEYPPFLRESLRPTQSLLRDKVRKYLFRRDPKAYMKNAGGLTQPTVNLSKDIHKDWPQTGTAYFSTGDGGDMLDFGIMKDRQFEFLKLAAGVGVARPADLVLSGHIHDNLECRIKWDSSKQKFLFFTDFYTENPAVYYNAFDIDIKTDKDVFALEGAKSIEKKTVFRQVITEEAGDNESMTKDENGFFVLRTKGYPAPLKNASTKDAVKRWWENSRPLLIQTEAIGPMKSQRNKEIPQQPVFNGCRHITVADNLIDKIRYDRKESITNRLSGVEPFYAAKAHDSLGPVLHMMMR